MFMGPLEASKPWSQQGVEGAQKFLDRIYRLYESGKIKDEENKNLEKVYHQTDRKFQMIMNHQDLIRQLVK